MPGGFRQADALPYGESLMLLETIYDGRIREAKFAAALHGKELR